MKRKGADKVGDYDDAFSPVPAAGGFRTILSLATQPDMFTESDHVDISQAFVQGKLLPHLYRVIKKILDTFIASLSHCMACCQPLVRGIRR